MLFHQQFENVSKKNKVIDKLADSLLTVLTSAIEKCVDSKLASIVPDFRAVTAEQSQIKQRIRSIEQSNNELKQENENLRRRLEDSERHFADVENLRRRLDD